MLKHGALKYLEGGEGSFLPNGETILVIPLHVSIVLSFHKHNSLCTIEQKRAVISH